jgi:hypothetical protein
LPQLQPEGILTRAAGDHGSLFCPTTLGKASPVQCSWEEGTHFITLLYWWEGGSALKAVCWKGWSPACHLCMGHEVTDLRQKRPERTPGSCPQSHTEHSVLEQECHIVRSYHSPHQAPGSKTKILQSTDIYWSLTAGCGEEKTGRERYQKSCHPTLTVWWAPKLCLIFTMLRGGESSVEDSSELLNK